MHVIFIIIDFGTCAQLVVQTIILRPLKHANIVQQNFFEALSRTSKSELQTVQVKNKIMRKINIFSIPPVVRQSINRYAL